MMFCDPMMVLVWRWYISHVCSSELPTMVYITGLVLAIQAVSKDSYLHGKGFLV